MMPIVPTKNAVTSQLDHIGPISLSHLIPGLKLNQVTT